MPKIYPIEFPAIPSAGIYYFNTDNDIRYEVRFGRKETDLLSVSIVFGVLNEEYEGEEYIITNKGEVFNVMLTIVEIVNIFKDRHPNIRQYEFTGEPAKDETIELPTKRIKLFRRYLPMMFDSNWDIYTKGSYVRITKKQD